MIYSREQLRELLDVSEVNLAQIIRRKQLEDRLSRLGYEYRGKTKKGNFSFYEIVNIADRLKRE